VHFVILCAVGRLFVTAHHGGADGTVQRGETPYTIGDLLAHGLIRSSFVPPTAIQELRDLTRTRKQLVREMSQHSLRIQKILEDAKLKLGSVLSNVLGRSGVAMLEAIIQELCIMKLTVAGKAS
jgi:hypothetical protein